MVITQEIQKLEPPWSGESVKNSIKQFEKRSRYWVCQELMGEFLGNQDSQQ